MLQVDRRSTESPGGARDRAGRRRRVLVADHDPDLRAPLKQRLDAEGFDVTVAATTEELVETVDRTRFDVVVLDPSLPGARSRDVMFFVRHRWPGTPIVLLGLGGRRTAGPLSRRWGVAATLPRPVAVTDLAGALQALVRHQITPPWLPPGAGSAPARAIRPAVDSTLQIVVHARRRGRLRDVLDAVTPSVPPERIVVVGVRRDAEAIEQEVARLPSRPHVLLQPRDRGSAAAILLGAYYVRRNAPDATVGVLPAASDVVPGPAVVGALEEAARFVSGYPRWIVLLGERRTRGTLRDLWIVPASVLACSDTTPVWRAGAVFTTGRPPTRTQRAAAFRGTGLLVAKAARLVSGTRQLVPALHGPLLSAVPLIGSEVETRALQRAYALMPRLDFASALLARALGDVAVASPAGVGWDSPAGLEPALRHRIANREPQLESTKE